METSRARELLNADKARTLASLDDARSRGADDRAAAGEQGGMFDAAEPLVDQGLDDSIVAALRQHLDAIDRAERRLDAGTYGRSIRSGAPIPDARLEADPTAELTAEEASDAGTVAI
jgi:DnaK suppressor protein